MPDPVQQTDPHCERNTEASSLAQRASRRTMLVLKLGNNDGIEEIRDYIRRSEMTDSDVAQAISSWAENTAERTVKFTTEQDGERISSILEAFPVARQTMLAKSEVQRLLYSRWTQKCEAYLHASCGCTLQQSCPLHEVLNLAELYQISRADVVASVCAITAQNYATEHWVRLRNEFAISDEEIQSPEARQAFIESLMFRLEYRAGIDYAELVGDDQGEKYSSAICDRWRASHRDHCARYGISEAESATATLRVILKQRALGNLDLVTRIIDTSPCSLDEPIPSGIDEARPWLYELIENWQFPNVRAVISFILAHPRYVDFVSNSLNAPTLCDEDIPAVETLKLPWAEADDLKGLGFDLAQIANIEDPENRARFLFEALTATTEPVWGNELDELNSFRVAAQEVGYAATFQYLADPEGLADRHDQLIHLADFFTQVVHPIRALTADAEAELVSPHAIATNILFQVQADKRNYACGDAYAMFRRTVERLEVNIPDVLHQLSVGNLDNASAQDRETFQHPTDILRSWKHLKRFSELAETTSRVLTLQCIERLRLTGDNLLATFATTLLERKGPHASYAALRQFIEAPAAFFARGDSTTNAALLAAYGTEALLKIPLLDFSAKDLRTAQISGVIKRLSPFVPFEAHYRIPVDEDIYLTCSDAACQALGTRDYPEHARAKSPTKLFHRLRELFDAHGLDVRTWVQGAREGNPPRIPAELEEAAGRLIFDPIIGIKLNSRHFIAKICFPDDPDAHDSGDQTDNCAIFGSGKKNSYGAYPNGATLIVKVEVAPGQYRTILDSLLTKDLILEWPVNTWPYYDMLQIIPRKAEANTRFLALDNIETAPNWKERLSEIALMFVVEDFLRSYLERHAQRIGVDPSTVTIALLWPLPF